MNDLYTEVGFGSLNKYGEQLCGDHVEVAAQDERSTVVVLADGLGSGVKASILSILTAKIISTMMANSLTLEDCVETIAAALPICKTRRLAYSTFTIIRIIEGFEAEIIQYDNPHAILLREGKNRDYPIISEIIDRKTIYISRIKLRENDALIAFSDGVVHAGTGLSLNLGWRREDIIDFMEKAYEQKLTAKTLSTLLLNECLSLYGSEPGDDATVCAVRIRRRAPLNLLIGPPKDPNDAPKMMSLFFSKEGKHIVCGGATSALAADYLNKPLETDAFAYTDPQIPPTAKIDGVDLVTEGAVTIGKTLEYARDYLEGNESYADWCHKKDGASLIAKTLFEEATDINFFVGRAVNPAHQNPAHQNPAHQNPEYQNPAFPAGFGAKARVVEELAECLEKMGKKIKVSYF
jgi:hypothetical protein